MGLKYTDLQENKYKVYYQVISGNRDISNQLNEFDEAFLIFEKTVLYIIEHVPDTNITYEYERDGILKWLYVIKNEKE